MDNNIHLLRAQLDIKDAEIRGKDIIIDNLNNVNKSLNKKNEQLNDELTKVQAEGDMLIERLDKKLFHVREESRRKDEEIALLKDKLATYELINNDASNDSGEIEDDFDDL